MKSSIFSQTKILFIISWCFASMTSVMSQTFSILPSNAISDTAACGTSPHANTIYISNPTSSALDLKYTVVSNAMPDIACWDYMFCDWNQCFPYLPSGTTYPQVLIPANTYTASMILDVTPFNNKGQGSFVITILETNNPSNSQTVTWNIYGCQTGTNCTAGIFETVDNNNFVLFPNPAEDFINVEITNSYKPCSSIQVYNVVGEKLLEYSGIKNNKTKIDLTKLPAGGYFIKYYSGEGVSVKQFFKIK